MTPTTSGLFAIRLMAVLMFVLSSAYAPQTAFEILRQHAAWSRFDTALTLFWLASSQLVLPAIIWFAAPYLARFLESGPEGTGSVDGTPITFKHTVRLLGLFLLSNAIPGLIFASYGFFLYMDVNNTSVGDQFLLQTSIRQTLFSEVVRMSLGLLLFLKPDLLLKKIATKE